MIRTPPSPAPAKVAVFCNTYLPYSQTFVWDEVRSHERYAPEIFAWRRRNESRFPGPAHLARPWYPLTGTSSAFDARLAGGGISLIHAHFGWAGVLAHPFARRYSLPLVVTFHGYDVALLARPRAPFQMWPYTWRARDMLEGMTLGLCASSELLELLASLGVPRERLAEHRLGVDLERFKRAPRPATGLRVAMVGRLVEKKGFADGVRAFAAACLASDDAKLSIAGDGPLKHDLQRLCAELAIQSRVTFLGAVSHAQIAELLAQSDVLLAPSAVARDGDRDSGLLSVKEASACECIPIATRHGGIPTIIDHETTGYLVPEHDVQAMAACLRVLAADDARRRAMGSAARAKMAAQFELRASVRRLEERYDEAILRHTPRDRLSAGIARSRPSSQ